MISFPVVQNSRIIGVQFGRFAPYHRGHQAVTEEIIQRHGEENTLIIVGKTQTLTQRTPFSFEERKAMIRAVYPQIALIEQPHLILKEGSSRQEAIDDVLRRIDELQQTYNGTFRFYGGSEQDLRGVAHKFPTEVIIDRSSGLAHINGTRVRELLAMEEQKELLTYLDPRVIAIAIQAFRENMNILLAVHEDIIPPKTNDA